MYAPTPGTVLVKAGSHRARAIVSTHAVRSLFSWDRPGCWFEVPEHSVPFLCSVRGVSRARWRDDLRPTTYRD